MFFNMLCKTLNWVESPQITTMYSLRKQYNLARKQLKSNFYSSLPDKVNASYNNTKQFWRNFNTCKSKQFESTSAISMEDWVNHFLTLLTSNEYNPIELDLDNTNIDGLSPLDFPFTCRGVKIGILTIEKLWTRLDFELIFIDNF